MNNFSLGETSISAEIGIHGLSKPDQLRSKAMQSNDTWPVLADGLFDENEARPSKS